MNFWPSVGLVFVSSLVACSSAPLNKQPIISPTKSAQIACRSVEGRPIPFEVHGEGRKNVLIIAGIHGNEGAGSSLLKQLSFRLSTAELNAKNIKLILVPEVNVDGLFKRKRHNARGVDLNRNFPASNRQPSKSHGQNSLSEPESQCMYDLIIKYKPERIISIHQPLGCIDFDGTIEPLARAMAAKAKLPVRKLGARPGSLGSFAALDLGIPVITVELPRSADALKPEILWDQYAAMLQVGIMGSEQH